MSTVYGYVVHSETGESVPLERCLVVSGHGLGRPTVADKTNGRMYQNDKSWVWVPGADDTAEEIMNHPTFRMKMLGKAIKSGEDLDALARLTFSYRWTS